MACLHSPTQAEMRERARRRPSPWRTPEPKDRTLDGGGNGSDGCHLRAIHCTNINHKLHQEFPDRTLEAIKGMRSDRRLPKYRALLGRSRVLVAVASVKIPPSVEVKTGASSQVESLLGSPPSPGLQDMTQSNVIRAPDVPSEERSLETRSEEDHVREV